MFESQVKMIASLRKNYADKFMYQQPETPLELIEEITGQLGVSANQSILVLFTVEWALYLQEVGYNNVCVASNGDAVIESLCKKLGLKYQDISEIEKNKMKFDVVVGNPPYQDKVGNENSTSSADLASRFVLLSLSIGSIVALVIPSDWAGPNKSILKKTLFSSNKLTHLCLYKDKWFNVKKHTCCIMYDANYNGDCKVTDISGNTILLDLSSVDCISLTNVETLFLQKFANCKKSLADRWIHGSLYLNNVVETNSGVEFVAAVGKKTESVKTITIDPQQESTGLGLHKVVLPGVGDNGKIGNIKLSNPNQVGGHSVVFLTTQSDAESVNLKTYLETKFVRFLIKSIKKSTPNSKSVFKNIPDINVTRPWTDAEVYAYFELTQDEINLVEATVK